MTVFRSNLNFRHVTARILTAFCVGAGIFGGMTAGAVRADDLAITTDRATPISVSLDKLRFTSDYSSTSATYAMLANDTDAKPTGPALRKPDWVPAGPDGTGAKNNPISHKMDTNVGIWLDLTVSPADAKPAKYHLVGSQNGSDIPGFNFDAWITLKGGSNGVPITSLTPLPREITYGAHTITWNLYAENGVQVMSQATGPHMVYTTYGQPNDEKNEDWYVSVYRTKLAIDRVKGAELTPVDLLMKAMSVPFHAGTAAQLYDSWDVGAPDSPGYDCISLARWTSNVAHQLGINSDTVKIQAEYVTATWDHPDVPLEIPFEGPFPPNAVPGHPNWRVVLSSAPGRYMSFEGSVKITEGDKTLFLCPGYGPNETVGTRTSAMGILHTYRVLGAINTDDSNLPAFVPHFNIRKGGYGVPPTPRPAPSIQAQRGALPAVSTEHLGADTGSTRRLMHRRTAERQPLSR